MVTSVRGKSSPLRFGFQPDFSTGAPAATHILPHYSEGFQSGEGLEDDPEIRGDILNDRDMTDPAPTLPSASGQITVAADMNNLAIWLQMMLGAPVLTGAGPFTRVFQTGLGGLPSASVAVPIGGERHKIVEGITANAWDFSFDKETGFKRMNFGFNARRAYNVTGAEEGILTGDPVNLPRAKLPGSGFSVAINGVQAGRILGGSFSLQNNLEAENFADGEAFPGGQFEGDVGLTMGPRFRLTRQAAGSNFLDLFDGRTNFAVTLAAALSPTSSIEIEMPRVFGENRSPVVGGTGAIEFEAGMRASQTETTPAATITLINAVPALVVPA